MRARARKSISRVNFELALKMEMNEEQQESMNQVLKHWKTQLDKYEWEHVSPNEYFDITNIKQEIFLHMVCDILTGTFSP